MSSRIELTDLPVVVPGTTTPAGIGFCRDSNSSVFWDDGGSISQISNKELKTIYESRANTLHADYSNFTPTHFFDPSAINSSGVGTLANPFTTAAQISSYVSSVSGALAGKIFGFKRGSTYRGKIALADIYGSNGSPVIFCPYGDAENRPVITGTVISSGWVNYAADTRIWYKAAAYEQEFYDAGQTTDITEYHRYYKKSSIANLQAAGAGYACYTGGFAYLFPLDGSNPNLGHIEETNESTSVAAAVSVFDINYANVAATGNIHVYGLAIRGSRTSSLKTHGPGTTTTISTIINIVYDDIWAGQSGTDNATTGGSDGLLIEGVSDTKRITGGVVSNCLAFDVLNNAVEVSAFDSGYIEWNQSKRVSGKSVAELWYSCSTNKIQYNIGSGLRNETFTPGLINFADRGVWIPGFSAASGSGSQDATKNVNNVIAFNYVKNCRGAAVDLGAGTATVVNNTLLAGDKPGGTPCIRIGQYGAVTVDLSNNIAIMDNYSAESGGADIVFSSNAADVITGNNNILADNTGASRGCTFRNVSQASVSAWVTAVQVVTAGAQSATFSAQPVMIDGVPLRGSSAVNGGAAVSGYAVDLNNEPLRGNHIGALQPINSRGY